jgi:endo-1,4-beta-xylanase
MKRNIRIQLIVFCLVLAWYSSYSQNSLKTAFKGDFLIGTAVSEPEYKGNDPKAVSIIQRQFNAITPENALKWDFVNSNYDQYTFDDADSYVAFGESNHMFITGHVLIWHHQTPSWVFQGGQGALLTRDPLLARMREHIFKVVGRYKGRVNGWDVVNEALTENGKLFESQWEKIIGPDYIEKAFQYAHEADPNAELYYCDYNLEQPIKRAATVRLVRKLKSEGIPITAVGLEAHYQLDWPSTNLVDRAIKEFARLGVKVMVTELDVDVLPQITFAQLSEARTNAALQAKVNIYTNGLPEGQQQLLARRYADLFKVFLANRESISRVTIWGATDGYSWLNQWPVPDRMSYPLLFGRDYQPKAALYAVLKVAQGQNISSGPISSATPNPNR